jgi:hypothetical protein
VGHVDEIVSKLLYSLWFVLDNLVAVIYREALDIVIDNV